MQFDLAGRIQATWLLSKSRNENMYRNKNRMYCVTCTHELHMGVELGKLAPCCENRIIYYALEGSFGESPKEPKQIPGHLTSKILGSNTD